MSEVRSCVVSTPVGLLRLTAEADRLVEIQGASETTPIDEPTDDFLQTVAAALKGYFRGEVRSLTFPLALNGSDFEMRVLEAMRRIPYGTTRTYAELAEEVGRPGAARAVGSVCRKNCLLFVLPCHRVTAADGRLSYQLGPEVKRRLLQLEAGDVESFAPLASDAKVPVTDEALHHLCRLSDGWAKLVSEAGRIERPMSPGLFSGLLRSFISQQISTKAAATIHARVAAACGPLTPEHLLTVDPVFLRAQGLSEVKVDRILTAARSFAAGEFSEAGLLRLSDEELIGRLTVLPGVGPWTAEMIALFTLGRPNILSLGDLGIRRGFERLHGRALTMKQMQYWKRRLSPHGSVASLYLWHLASGGLPDFAA